MPFRGLFPARAFSGASRTLTAAVASAPPYLLPADQPLEEERFPGYDPTHFYPVALGDTLNGKYKVITKLGFGRNSTVWLGSYEEKGSV